MIKLPTIKHKLLALKQACAEAGLISIEEVEERLLTAHKTLWALSDDDYKFLRIRSNWPEVLRADYVDEEHNNELLNQNQMQRFEPTPHDVSDCLVALAWLQPLSKREKAMIVWKARDLNYMQMAYFVEESELFKRTKCSDTTARTYYRNAMSNAWAAASLQNAKEAHCSRGKALWARLRDDCRAD